MTDEFFEGVAMCSITNHRSMYWGLGSPLTRWNEESGALQPMPTEDGVEHQVLLQISSDQALFSSSSFFFGAKPNDILQHRQIWEHFRLECTQKVSIRLPFLSLMFIM